MKRLLGSLALLLALGGSAFAQGVPYTAGPFTSSGLLYVCPAPSGGTPCPSPSAIFSNVTLTTAVANPLFVAQGNTVTFYIAAGTYTVQFPASGQSTVVTIGGGGGITSALAPSNPNTFYASPSCTSPNVGNCYFVQATGHFVYDATWPSGATPTITTGASDPPFLNTPCASGGSVGCEFFATNQSNNSGGITRTSSITVIPITTITSVTDAHHAVVAATASAACATHCFAAWGPSEDANINAVYNAAATTCGKVRYPSGTMLIDNPVGQTVPVCGNVAGSLNGASHQGMDIGGEAVASTYFVGTPNFVTHLTGITGALFGGAATGGQLHDFSFNGGDNNGQAPPSNANVLISLSNNANAYNLNLVGLGASTGGVGCLQTAGQVVSVTYVICDGIGNQNGGGGNNGAECLNQSSAEDTWVNVACVDTQRVAFTNAVGAVITVLGSAFGLTSGGSICAVEIGGTFESKGENSYMGNNGGGANNICVGRGGAATATFDDSTNISGTNVFSNNQNAVHVFSGATANIQKTGFGCSGTGTVGLLVDSGATANLFGGVSFPSCVTGVSNAGTLNDFGQNTLGTVANTGTSQGQNVLRGSASGVCTPTSTLGLYGLGQFAALTCTSTVVNLGQVMDRAGTLLGLTATSTANGVSGVVTVLKNGSATTITCSLAGVQRCNDYAHATAYAVGDVISAQVVTGAAETLANVNVGVWRQ